MHRPQPAPSRSGSVRSLIVAASQLFMDGALSVGVLEVDGKLDAGNLSGSKPSVVLGAL